MKKSMIACLAVGLVMAGGLVALLGPRHCPVNRAAFERIEEGMTQAEVRAIMGPTGDHRTRPSHPDHAVGFDADIRLVLASWTGDDGSALVQYVTDPHGRLLVARASFIDSRPFAPGLLELARWRLRKLGAWLP